MTIQILPAIMLCLHCFLQEHTGQDSPWIPLSMLDLPALLTCPPKNQDILKDYNMKWRFSPVYSYALAVQMLREEGINHANLTDYWNDFSERSHVSELLGNNLDLVMRIMRFSQVRMKRKQTLPMFFLKWLLLPRHKSLSH